MEEHQCEMDKQMSETLSSKRAQMGLFSNLWFHDLANRMKIRRQSEAKVMGLGDDYPVGTYPSHGGVVVQDSGGFWRGIVVSALALGGMGGGAVALNGLITPESDHKKTPVSAEYLYEIEVIGTDTGVKVNSVEAVDEP